MKTILFLNASEDFSSRKYWVNSLAIADSTKEAIEELIEQVLGENSQPRWMNFETENELN